MKPKSILISTAIVGASIISPINFTALAQKQPLDSTTVMMMQLNQPEYNTVKPTFTEADYRERIQSISDEVNLTYNKYVKKRFQSYARYPHFAEKLIGKSTIYLPLFEAELAEQGVPDVLKYLPLIESSMQPTAVSGAGAAGLWQLMPYTAKELGLNITPYVDERLDPYLSTTAAVTYLKQLNERYDDWLMTIAAYNCGPGRVNKAIRQANSTSFWKIYRYLPKETRGYVPAFISAAYMMNFYYLHDMNPVYPSMDYQVTDTIKVYEHTPFDGIVKRCDVELNLVKALNPSYKMGVIPANQKGYVLTLPSTAMAHFLDETPIDEGALAQVQAVGEKQFITLPETNDLLYEVQHGETLWDIARNYPGVSVKDIIRENKLADLSKVKPGNQLKIPKA